MGEFNHSVDSQEAIHAIRKDGAHLYYRRGQNVTWELYDLFVPDKRRRRGVGRRLVIEMAERTGGIIFGFTRAEYTGAQAFYRSLGFTLYPAPGLYAVADGFSGDALLFICPASRLTAPAEPPPAEPPPAEPPTEPPTEPV